MNINLENNSQHIHFVGIGGISMSGLAEILNYEGFKVSGSDIRTSEITESLKAQGIDVIIGQKAENITEECYRAMMNYEVEIDD